MDDGKTVFVGNLSYRANKCDENFFRGFGRIQSVTMNNNFAYAFVDFDDERAAKDAINEQNGREFFGQHVTVELSHGTTIYVGNLSSQTNKHQLGSFFQGFGRIRNISLKNKLGHAFLVFDNERDAKNALKQNGRELFGKHVAVKYTRWCRTRYRLLVYNLSTNYSWQNLKDLMRNAGEVIYAEAHIKGRPNEGVVHFASHVYLKRAIDKYQGKEIYGRCIKLVDDSDDGYGVGGGGEEHNRSSHTRSSRSHSNSVNRSRSRSPLSRSSSLATGKREPTFEEKASSEIKSLEQLIHNSNGLITKREFDEWMRKIHDLELELAEKMGTEQKKNNESTTAGEQSMNMARNVEGNSNDFGAIKSHLSRFSRYDELFDPPPVIPSGYSMATSRTGNNIGIENNLNSSARNDQMNDIRTSRQRDLSTKTDLSLKKHEYSMGVYPDPDHYGWIRSVTSAPDEASRLAIPNDRLHQQQYEAFCFPPKQLINQQELSYYSTMMPSSSADYTAQYNIASSYYHYQQPAIVYNYFKPSSPKGVPPPPR